MLLKDLTGQKFGRLTVQNFHKRDKGGRAQWLCKCECGVFRTIEMYNLTTGHTRSCGCLSRERSSERGKLRIKHGHTAGKKRSRTYSSFMNMITRCHNQRDPSYKNYGAKGITLCKRWRHSFLNFLKDMGERPLGKTIHRINGKRGYSKRNCRWATPAEQQQNTSLTKLSPLKVRTIRRDAAFFTHKELAQEFGVSRSVISSVIAGKAWANVTV
jgi:hypothetical protein